MDNTHDIIIIGTGPAGLAASLYAGRYKMKILTISKEFGGAAAKAGKIHNYPGVKAIDGYELAKIMKEQAAELGTEFLEGEVTSVTRNEDGCTTVTVDDKTYTASTLIFAHGTVWRHLGIPNEEKLTGKGVHYCATCDGPLYGGKKVAIVGGGDSSIKGANLTAEYAEKIYIITLDDDIHAEPINREILEGFGDKIEIISNNTVSEIIGETMLEKVILKEEFNGSKELVVDGLFVEIGSAPNPTLAKSIGVETDERGYIKVSNMMETNVPGVFAAGDIVNHFGPFKQDITAAALGSVAATSAYNYEKKHGDVCHKHGQVKTS